MKLYLFAFNDLMGTQKAVTDFLNTRPEVLNWGSALPHSLFIVSQHTELELTSIIQTAYPGRFFLLSEITGASSNGFLPKWVWDFINFPKPSGRWSLQPK